MKNMFKRMIDRCMPHYKTILFSVFITVVSVGLLMLPTGFELPEEHTYDRVRAEVLEVNNEQLEQIGFVKTGAQIVKAKIKEGQFSERVVEAPNLLSGKLEMDKIFEPGDQILMVVSFDHDTILDARAIEHYRLHMEWLLVAIFACLLLSYAGWTGVQALLSFGFTLLMIWKVMIPMFLKGYSPLLISTAVVMTLCGVTIFLVAGLNRKGLTAFLGSATGVLATCVMAIFFGNAFKIHGAVVPYAETLLHSGFAELDLTAIFLSGIYLASAGAVMDIAMDLAASMHELVEKKPDITRRELLTSGFAIGRAVIGTMTTTLLLAYSGGYTALFMLFMAQGIPMINIFNLTFIAAEILHTMVGSFGLILTAPMTAVLGAFIFAAPDKKTVESIECTE